MTPVYLTATDLDAIHFALVPLGAQAVLLLPDDLPITAVDAVLATHGLTLTCQRDGLHVQPAHSGSTLRAA